MTLAELRTALRNRTGISLEATVATEFINDALQTVSTARDWPWLEKVANVVTVNGTGSYAVPADWARSVSVVSASGIPLRRSPIDLLDYVGAGAGAPKLFGIFADALIVRPTPNAVETLTHRYVRTTPALSADGDTPTIPAGSHGILVEYAAYLVFRHAGDTERAGVALSSYERWLDSMEKQADRFSESEGGALRADEVETVTQVKART